MNKNNFQLEDFLNDSTFRRWTLNNDTDAAAYWEEWLIHHPEEEDKLLYAQKVLRSLQPARKGEAEQARQRVWQKLQQAGKQPTLAVRPQPTFPYWQKAAAVLLPLLGIALVMWWLQAGNIETIATAYGEIQDVELPDGSRLTLNGNSSVRFENDWNDPASREVWLEGEALFMVTRRPLKEVKNDSVSFAKFTVHTDELDIEVLGTTFSVNHRKQETQVILTEGKVKVITQQQDDEDVIMQEGEMISYANNQLQLLQVDTESKHSWKDELVIFKDTPVGEILLRLKNTYGYRVEMDANSKLAERRFSGSFPRDSVDVLLDKLVKLYQEDIQIQDKIIVITD